MNTYKLNVGSNRGRARLWLQGAVLLEAGLTRGTRYDLEYDEAAKVLVVKAEDGNRKVVGRPQRGSVADFPIIDINTKALDALVNPASGRKLDLAVIVPSKVGLTIVLQNADLAAAVDEIEKANEDEAEAEAERRHNNSLRAGA